MFSKTLIAASAIALSASSALAAHTITVNNNCGQQFTLAPVDGQQQMTSAGGGTYHYNGDIRWAQNLRVEIEIEIEIERERFCWFRSDYFHVSLSASLFFFFFHFSLSRAQAYVGQPGGTYAQFTLAADQYSYASIIAERFSVPLKITFDNGSSKNCPNPGCSDAYTDPSQQTGKDLVENNPNSSLTLQFC